MLQRMRVTKTAAALVLVAAGMLLLATLAGGRAEAAKGGKNGGGSIRSATCSVSPNPAALYSQVTINGSGFAPDSSYGFTVANSSGSVYMAFAASDGSGNISTTYNTVWTGTNTVDISGGGIAATCTFSVN